MSAPCSGIGSAARRAGTWPFHEVILLGSLLAFGVIAWEHAIHAYLLGRSDTMGANLVHWLRDSAGGTLGVPGDYLYSDHRFPFTRAGLWGIFRVYGTTQADLVAL